MHECGNFITFARQFWSALCPAIRDGFCVLLLKKKNYIVLLTLLLIVSGKGVAAERMFRCELGIAGGCGYYVGDATPHIFMNIRETYGAYFRYRFDQRWALQAKGLTQRIAGNNPDGTGFAAKGNGQWQNQLVNVDVMGEFNFFRFGPTTYDMRVKPISPYLGLGLGMAIHSEFKQVSVYIPVTVGVKWQLAPRLLMYAAWQHNLYTTDNLENVTMYNDLHGLNGSNWLNCDLTGTLTVGASFIFAMDKKVCRFCGNND